jgi:hypothetical protein
MTTLKKKTLFKHLNYEFPQNYTQEFKCFLSIKQTERLMLFRERATVYSL